MTSGRNPRGSRAASSVSPIITQSAYAPSTPANACASRSVGVSVSAVASRCSSTSESLVEVKIEPRSSSSNRSSVAFVRFPLCASPIGVPRKLTSSGWALSSDVDPAVL